MAEAKQALKPVVMNDLYYLHYKIICGVVETH